MNNYQAWLETGNIARVLIIQASVNLAGTETVRYLSTRAVTVDGLEYLPIVKNEFTLDESISVNYSASISYGDLELANNNGDYDSWLQDTWVNRSIKIWVGPVPQPGTSSVIGDFEQIFSGLIADIDSKSRTSLNLKLRDNLEKVNLSVTDTLLGNYYQGSIVAETTYVNQYRNSLKPLVYGEVHNITPLLSDPTALEYMVCSEAVEQIIEVRDNGMPVPFLIVGTPAIPAGSFRLVYPPAGAVTCSVQGIKRTVNISSSSYSSTYTNTAANTISTILKFAGLQLQYNELDSASFTTLGTQGIGVYLPERQNVLQVCQEIAKSCGLILTTTRLGVLKLVELDIPVAASFTITEADMLLNTLAVSQRLEVSAGVKLGYAKNWTVQPSLLTGIPTQHKDLYATEWLESSQVDTAVKAKYLITAEPGLEPSYLIDKSEADSVSLKKLNLFRVPRKILSVTCTAKLLTIQVGDPVLLTSTRFGLNGGTYGRVVSTKPNWLRGIIDIGILV